MLRDRIRPFIPEIVSRKLTNRELARELGASEGAVCRVLKQLKVVREPIPFRDVAAERELSATRREMRINAAKTLSVKEAAAAANCSIRTIYRLRKKHHVTQEPEPQR